MIKALVRRLFGRGFLLSLLLCSLCSFGQRDRLRFERVGLERGLSVIIVNAIAQDQQGFLWMGTQDGLNRFDGYRFTYYKHRPQTPGSISDNQIYELFVDEQGRLWVGTDGNGLNLYDRETDSFELFPVLEAESTTPVHDGIHAIAQDKEGRIWAGTFGHGLSRIEEDGRFTHFRNEPGSRGSLASNHVNDIMRDRSDVLWIATRLGLERYDAALDRFEHFDMPLAEPNGNEALSLLDDPAGIWVGCQQGLFLFKPRDSHFEQPIAEMADLKGITAILRDDKENLWLGTANDGLVRIDLTRQRISHYQTRVGDQLSLSSNKISGLLTDHSGVLWIAGYEGLNKYNPKNEIFNLYHYNGEQGSGLVGRQVWAVYEDRDGSLWVGTGEGISRFDQNGEHVQDYQHADEDRRSLSHNAVRDFLEDRHGDFWVTTRGGGLNRMNRETGEFSHYRHDPSDPKSLSHDNAWQVYEDSQGRLWVSTDGGGLNLFLANERAFARYQADPNFKGSISHDRVSSMHEDQKNRFWVGTFGGGLNLMDRDTGRFKGYLHQADDPSSLSHNRVLSIYEDKLGKLWIGTWGGLNRFNPKSGKFRVWREKDGLPSDVVYGVRGDDKGYLWMSTNKGLCRLDPDKSTTTVYDVRDGLQSNEFNAGAFFESDLGEMYFGGVNGLSSFYPAEVRKDFHQPKLVLTDFLLFNKVELPKPDNPDAPLRVPIQVADEVVLRHQDYIFSFEFAALHYAAPEKNRYAYKLDGFDASWIYTDASKRFATYTNIRQGNYLFRVKGSNKDGVWNEDGASIRVVVLPPIWNTWWARLTYVLVILILIGSVLMGWRRKLRYERQVRETIRESEERLKFALWGSGDDHWDWDIKDGTIYRSNQSGQMDFPENGRQENLDAIAEWIHPNDFPRLKKAWEHHMEGKSPYFEATYRVRGKRRDWVWVLDRGKVVGRDTFGIPTRISGTIKDISHLKDTEDQLRMIAIAFENTSDGVFITDQDFIIAAVNKSFTRITGREQEEVIGRPFRIARIKHQDDAFSAKVLEALRDEGRWVGELWERRKNQEVYQQELVFDRVEDSDGEVCHYVGVFSDITFRKKAEEELRHMANYDLLTDLPNRTLFQEHLDQRIHEANRTRRNFAVLFIDLDNFKNINDSLGHSIGDQLLIEVGKRLVSCVRAEDVVARFGGDEFSVLLKEVPMVHGAARVAEKIITSMSRPFALEGHNIVTSPSIGIVLYPSDGERPEDLLRNADTAMYHAKGRGKNNYQFFTEEMNERVLHRMQMEADLRGAIEENELILYYQPKVSFKDGSIVGMEALVRWISPKHGFVSPGRFISVAEETGLVVPMGKLVIRRACMEGRRWADAGLLAGRVAVNLSALQFRQTDLIEFIDEVLMETGFPSDKLEFEITEGALMENAEHAVRMMRQFKDRGIHLAIDDFGTGFSSLSYLRKFPVNSLKVDRSFVVDMAHREDDRTIVSSIVGLAHNLGIKVVAEGVEDFDQVDILKEMGCEEMQGFLFSKPVSPEDMTAMLQSKANMYE